MQVAEQRRVVQDVLRELGVSEETLRERVIEVWNKVEPGEIVPPSAPMFLPY
jgi:hypothetical protein